MAHGKERTKRETSQALNVILERLYAMTEQEGAEGHVRGNLKTAILAVPPARRSQVALVLECLESRAQATSEEAMARASRLVLNAATSIWGESPSTIADKDCGEAAGSLTRK